MLEKGESGNATAQIYLGQYYARSKKPEDSLEALKWYKMAAKQGDPRAQAALGSIYSNGFKAVPKDLKKAVFWLKKAAKQKHIEAQFVLGRLHSSEDSKLYDAKIADKWITKAAENGFPAAIYAKAMLCFNADKFHEAEKWHLKAAEKNIPNSATQLGLMYFFPQMLGPDYIKSYAWLKLAKSFKKSQISDKSRQMAANYLSKIEEKLSPKQLKKAEELFESLKTSKKP